MMARRIPLLIIALASFSTAVAELYTVSCNVPVELVLPVGNPGAENTAYVKAKGDEHWQKLPVEVRDGTLAVSLDPGQFGSREILVLINPDPNRNIDDSTPPAITAVTVDGERLATGEDWAPDPMPKAPKTISWTVEDQGNALNPDSVRVLVDHSPLPPTQVDTAFDGSKGTVTARLGDIDYGTHRLTFEAADEAPETNTATWTATLTLVDASNVLRAAGDALEVSVDSHFESYPSIAPLTDGVRHLPGSSAGNDVTWASAESAEPHWIDLRLPKAVPIEEVTVYWARPSSASQNVQIQIRKGNDWVTVSEEPLGGYSLRDLMTFRFPEVVTERLRVYQPGGGGAPSRPNLMWVTEVEAR